MDLNKWSESYEKFSTLKDELVEKTKTLIRKLFQELDELELDDDLQYVIQENVTIYKIGYHPSAHKEERYLCLVGDDGADENLTYYFLEGDVTHIELFEITEKIVKQIERNKEDDQ